MTLTLTSPVQFEPVSKVTHVFFDDRNHQTFSVRSGGATGIMTRGFEPGKVNNATFRLEHDEGPISTIKLNPDESVLAIQRSNESNKVQFMEVIQGCQLGEKFTQTVKAKNCNYIIGFSWISNEDIALFTDVSIELYSVIPNKKLIKTIRTMTTPISWYIYSWKSSMSILSSQSNSKSLQIISIKRGYLNKVAKIDLESEARDKDVGIVTLYDDKSYVYVINHKSDLTEVTLYAVNEDEEGVNSFKTLKLSLSGSVAVNTVDKCVVLHHQKTATSYVYDLALEAGLGEQHPVYASKIKEQSLLKGSSYSQNWVTFQPDVLVDAKNGFMWKIRFNLDGENLAEQFDDNLLPLVKFLQFREGGKLPLLDVLFKLISVPELTDLTCIGETFDMLNSAYKKHVDQNSQLKATPFVKSILNTTTSKSSSTSATSSTTIVTPSVIIDQADLFSNLFTPLSETDSDSSSKRLTAILVEYYRSLSQHQIQPQYFLNELLIKTMVKTESWFQLHQMMNYKILTDSKPLACLLLSLENSYKPAAQLACDMLNRLKGNSKEDICEILLSKGKIVSALNLAVNDGILDRMHVRVLDAALESGNREVFRKVYNVCLKRNLLVKNSDYAKYHEEFNK